MTSCLTEETTLATAVRPAIHRTNSSSWRLGNDATDRWGNCMRKRDAEMLALGAAISHSPPRTEYVTKTVIQKRAPTDESVRLAKEYEEKAWKSVSDRVILDIKQIDAQVVYCEKSFEDRSKRLLFKVNGRKVDVRLDDGFDRDKHTIFREVADAITQAVITQLLETRQL